MSRHALRNFTSSTSTQVESLTISEGGIPPEAPAVLRAVGYAEQSEPSTSVDPNARIRSVALEESDAIPEARDDKNPEDWPEHVRGVPNFRAVNRQQDYETRPMGQNTPEFIFLTLMFTGVRTVGLVNKAWRATVGQYTDRIFRNKVGGEW